MIGEVDADAFVFRKKVYALQTTILEGRTNSSDLLFEAIKLCSPNEDFPAQMWQRASAVPEPHGCGTQAALAMASTAEAL